MKASPRPTIGPLVGFQLRSGGRLALLELAPLFGVISGLLAGMGPDFALSVATAFFPLVGKDVLVAPPLPGLASILVAAPFLAVASVAKRRMLQGTTGWLLHLPMTRLELRRSLSVGIAAACVVPTVGLLVLRLIRPGTADSLGLLLAVLTLSLVQFVCLSGAAAIVVLPVRYSARLLALAAILLSSAGVIGVGLAIGAVIAADRFGGPLRPRATFETPDVLQPRMRWIKAAPLSSRFSVFALHLSLTFRSLPNRIWLELLPALLPLGGAALFVANNEQLAPRHIHGAGRLGATLAITFALSSLVEALHKNRPPALFLRSLPWSAKQRVLLDVLLLGVLCLPLLVLCAVLHPAASPFVFVVTVFLLFRAGGHVRLPSKMGAGMDLLLEGGLVSALVTLVPWSSLLLVLLLPILLERAAERDRNLGTARIVT